MTMRYSPKANLLAGAFLVGGVVLAVGFSFVLSGLNFRPTRRYIVRFSVADGATGLAEDAAVRVGGQEVGWVESIAVEPDEAGELAVHARIRVRADIVLYEDAWAQLEVPLLASSSTINIPYLGSETGGGSFQGSSARLEPGETLRGTIAPPAFLAQAGFGPAQRDQLSRMFVDAETSVRRLRELIEKLEPKIEPIVTDAGEAVASVRRSVEGVETDLPGWRERVARALENAEAFSARFGPIADDVGLAASDARELIASGRAVVDDNRARIDNIIAGVEETTVRVRDEWVPKGSELLASAREGVESFRDVASRTDNLLAQETPGLERTLANVRTMSDQLKFLAIEARSQPWRLLHRPDTKELENQLLYDSARSYAVAVSDLRAASESLDAMIGEAARGGVIDGAGLQSMREKLQQAFDRYSGAEAALLERMIRANQ